ncbi:MAG TPA: AAA family ATPase, partial [Acidimicrobiales bacterium]|nr:AAA family ATPase [Acidimicrobiales bacterium]
GLPEIPAESDDGHRIISLTPASTIRVRPVRWLWEGRIPVGSLGLLGGREGIGKSTVCYQLTADVTRGRMPGVFHGTPKSVIIAATEDSWEHTIVPRLMAAGADLDRIYRVDVTTAAGYHGSLSLPGDLTDLQHRIEEVDAAMVLLDPLMSRIDAKLDTHKDGEVRQALEPLVALADRAGVALLGLIHVNKSATTDPLTMLMASRAFAAVARAVLFVTIDPDDQKTRILGQPKNNLGRTDLTSLLFTIDGAKVAETEEGPVWTAKVTWRGETDRTIDEILRSIGETTEVRTATQEAAVWLFDYLKINQVSGSQEIKTAAKKDGIGVDALKRARTKIAAGATSAGFPRRTYWSAPGLTPDQVDQHLASQSEQDQSEQLWGE